jgi:hypothetical protein
MLKCIVEAVSPARFSLMHRPHKASGLFGLSGCFQRTLVCVLGIGAFAFNGIAQSSLTTITNLAQLVDSLHRENQLVARISLNATVFACSTNTGVLILEDRSGACLLEIDGFEVDLQPGDEVAIASDSVFVSWGDIGVYLGAAPLLNNDGVHAPTTVSRVNML